MRIVKVTCKCGKQICYIENFNYEFGQKEIDILTEQGFNVIIGENLTKSELCLEPCYERDDCAFAKQFSTKAGFSSVYTNKHEDCGCSQTIGGKIHI